jgi:N-ethylmaleimide reductase
MQLWHCGRASHPTALPDGLLPVAPSAVKMENPVRPGRPPHVVPHALTLDEIPGIIAEFARGARLAKAAGFDGVELHGANGYFLDQFLRDKTNRRDDRYGGSIANRARLGLEVTEAVAAVWGADRVGYRLSPTSAHNDIADTDPHATFTYMTKALDQFGLAYLHIVEPQPEFPVVPGDPLVAAYFRPHWRGTLIANSGYTRARADAAIAAGAADLVSFGTSYIANPDLAERLRLDAAVRDPDRATIFINEPRGLTDYPTLAAAAA